MGELVQGDDGLWRNSETVTDPMTGREITVYYPPRRNNGPQYPQDTIEGAIRDRLSGMTLHATAQKWGVSHETVRRWCNEATQGHQLRDPEAIVKARAQVASELRALVGQAQQVMHGALINQNGKLALEAIKTASITLAQAATLLGLNAATKVEATVTQITEEDRAIQELINEAKAQAAVREAEVIRAASEDPDL